MTLLIVGLGVVLFAASLAVIARLWRQHEDARVARKWEERERLLDRRAPEASVRDVLQRRRRRD
jgi:hypothetical protein